MFSDIQNVVVNDGTFTMHQHFTTSAGGMESLKIAVAISAFHNSEERFDPPKCHSRTREAVLDRIMQWARREIDADKLMMWIYGAAGTGKSAIEQTIAEMCEGEVFIASFFFSRGDGSCNHSKAFVATIVYQMTVTTPALRPLIEAALEKDPLLLNKSLDTQVSRLLIQPIQRLLADGEAVGRYLLLVDGLDECMDDTRIQLIQEVERVVNTFSERSLFLASFASRPEPDIKNTFLYSSVSGILTRVALDDDYRADDDIRIFLSDKFTTLQRSRPRIPNTWPTQEQLDTLVYKASGQFIYASTVLNFVSSAHHNPIKRLDIVLGLIPAQRSSPFAQLDALYRQILLSVPEDCVEEGIQAVVLVHIMDSATSHFKTIKPTAVARVMEIDEPDFMMHMDNYASIITTKGPDGGLRPLHASLGDFLFDSERSKDLYRDPGIVHAYVFERLMTILASWDGEATLDNNWILRHAFVAGPKHFSLATLSISLLEHLKLIFQPSFVNNIFNPRHLGFWSMVDRLNMSMAFIHRGISQCLSLKFAGLEDMLPEMAKDCLLLFRQTMAMFLDKSAPEISRFLRLLTALHSGYHRLSDGSLGPLDFNTVQQTLTLFPKTAHPDQLMRLSTLTPQLLVYQNLDDPTIPACHRRLEPSECSLMAVLCLLFLHEHIFPEVGKPKRLPSGPSHSQFRASKYQANILFLNKQATLKQMVSPWPQYPAKTDPSGGEDVDWARDAASAVIGSVSLALKILPFLLRNSSSSYQLLQLCQKPNLKRFPWVTCPGLAPRAARAIRNYRRQFLVYRVPVVKDHSSLNLKTNIETVTAKINDLNL